MKRFAVVLTFAIFALAAPAAASPPIGHDHAQISASFTCASDGTQTIIWQIGNFTHVTTMTVTAWSSSTDPTMPLTTSVPPESSTTATGVVTPGTTTESATLTADWPTGREDVQHLTVSVPACTVPTTTPTTLQGQGSTVAPPTTSSASTTKVTTGGTLPFTGSSTGFLLALGVALAGIGGILANIGRTHRVR